MADTKLVTFTDPIAARWPDDSAASLLDDVIWSLSGEKGAVVDDLTIEKLGILAAALRPITLQIYDMEKLGRMTATVNAASAPITVSRQKGSDAIR